jgi:hypothetical protein
MWPPRLRAHKKNQKTSFQGIGDLSSGERKKAKRRQNPPGIHLRSLTVSMSRSRLFLGQVALQQSPPPLYRMAASVKDVWRQNVKDVPELDTRHRGHPIFSDCACFSRQPDPRRFRRVGCLPHRRFYFDHGHMTMNELVRQAVRGTRRQSTCKL